MPVDPTTVTSLQSGEVATVVPIVTVMAKAYTRGRGFTGAEPNEEIAAVISTASARLAANGKGLMSKKVDDVEYQYSLASTFGWTLAEQAVLNRYRVRAQ
ncbi:hypothetical protein [Mycobacterium sp. SMC-13]|uniref:hypothetical protein n=1 Tax=Mycobacterium sp. SMC-13 TaxID=3381626 RepID=UPI00092B0D0E|nr:Uncharacterised protein [Mycobacteroides abscessus subsp. abscessus]